MQRLQEDFLLGGRYRLISQVGSGGMGAVWSALDTRLNRRIAVKVMHPHTADEVVFAQRFREEALHAAALTSPHIVAVHDFGEDDGLAFLVMELVEGPTLAQALRERGVLPADEVRSIMAGCAAGLAVAHDAGIVHRDVKPANILLAPDGVAKLMDFGIARSVAGASLTAVGEVLGTPQYLAPEQALGQPATAASDLYALGIVAHQMLTGARPFDRETPVATALAQVNEPPPPLPTSVPADLADAVFACLEKAPTDRPTSARALAEALRRGGQTFDGPGPMGSAESIGYAAPPPPPQVAAPPPVAASPSAEHSSSAASSPSAEHSLGAESSTAAMATPIPVPARDRARGPASTPTSTATYGPTPTPTPAPTPARTSEPGPWGPVVAGVVLVLFLVLIFLTGTR